MHPEKFRYVKNINNYLKLGCLVRKNLNRLKKVSYIRSIKKYLKIKKIVLSKNTKTFLTNHIMMPLLKLLPLNLYKILIKFFDSITS